MARCWIAEGRSKLGKNTLSGGLGDNAKEYAPISIDTAEEVRLQVHVVEAVKQGSMGHFGTSRRHPGLLVDDLVPVGLNLLAGDILKRIFSGGGKNLGSACGAGYDGRALLTLTYYNVD